MDEARHWLLFLLLPALAITPALSQASPSADEAPSRKIAVTIDDLPGVFLPGRGCDPSTWRDFTRRLLGQMEQSDVVSTGFVNESKLCDQHREKLMPELLSMWLDAGHDLGNHTYSHRGFHRDLGGRPDPSFEVYRDEVLRGEEVTRALQAKRGKKPRYFRHPYLRTGPDDARKAAFNAFLESLGYTVAPVTIDNSEWIYARAYALAKAKDDSVAATKIGEAYLTHMGEMLAFYEQLSRDLLGREVAQILLIHANDLNADYFRRLAELIRHRGYQFVGLDEAMQDEAYTRGDVYTGPRGHSWLQRWLYGERQSIREEPTIPDWVGQAMRAES